MEILDRKGLNLVKINLILPHFFIAQLTAHTRKKCEICSKLPIKKPEQRQ